MTYAERPGGVAGITVWTSTADGSSVPVLPDGCMDLIWRDGDLLVAGPDTVAREHTSAAGTRYAAVRFAPGLAPGALGVPAHALRDQLVPLAAVWSRADAERLGDAMAAAADPALLLDRVATERLRAADAPSDVVAPVVALLEAGHPVAAVADHVGIGARHLHRLSLTAFGYGPKVLARVLRLQRALALARGGRPLAATAAEAGYADQAHLARDVRALTGRTMGQLMPGPGSGAKRSTPLPSGSRSVA